MLLWSVGRHGEQGADIEPFSLGRWRCSRTAGAATREIAIGPLLVERCILLSRMTVGTALSSAKCTFRRRESSGEAGVAARGPRSLAGTPVVVVDRPVVPLLGARGGTGCPNLPQRPGSSRNARRESLIFCAFVHGRSRPGAPLWQILTLLHSGSSQESHQHRQSRARPSPSPRRPSCGLAGAGTPTGPFPRGPGELHKRSEANPTVIEP